jgi:uncharacterized protein DUF542
MPENNTPFDLRTVAHQAMLDRGLEPDFAPAAIEQLRGIQGPASDTQQSNVLPGGRGPGRLHGRVEDGPLVPQSRIAMTSCDLDTSVPDWVIEHPETLAVFQELGIDYSCGGKSLAYACRERGLDAETALAKLLRCVDDEEQP